jgi:hypothetical protein
MIAIVHAPTVTSTGDSRIADEVADRLRAIVEDVTRSLEAPPVALTVSADPPAQPRGRP